MRRLLLVLILPGCVVHERVVGLDELGPVRMLIGARAASIHVEIESGAHPCPILAADFTASLRGADTSVPIAVTARGGEQRAIETGECYPIKLHLDTPPAIDPAELVLADSSTEVAIDLGGLLVAPSATLVPAGPWELAGNRTYRASLAQRAVMTQASDVVVKLRAVGVEPLPVPAMIDGEAIVFTTPTLPASGQATLSIQVFGPQFTDWECGPLAPACDMVIDRSPAEVEISYVP